MTHLVLLWLAAYLLASVPFGLLVARAKGVDIRRQGSGNVGATNVGRVLGRKWGALVLFLDALKGAGPVLIAAAAFERWPADFPDWGPPTFDFVRAGTGLACGLGSVAPVFAGFRGGKAVATSMGIVFAIFPHLTLPGAAAVTVFLLVRYSRGFVSLASLVAAISLPLFFGLASLLAGWPLARHYPLLLLCLALTTIVVVRHRANIARLRAGTEAGADTAFQR